MEEELYPGATIVGNAFLVLAWLIVTVGVLVGSSFGAFYDCTETPTQSCPNEVTMRFGIPFAIAVGSGLYALTIFATGYVIHLLRDIAVNTRPEDEEEE